MAGFIAGIANGQEAVKSVVLQSPSLSNANISRNSASMKSNPYTGSLAPMKSIKADRTTSGPGGGRWYDYQDGIIGGVMGDFISTTNLVIWNDTSSILGYTNSAGGIEYDGNNYTSLGLIFDPYNSGWADTDVFSSSLIGIAPTNAYSIDSVVALGWYSRNIAKTSVVDTLTLTFVQGDGLNSGSIYPSLPPYFYAGAGDATFLGWYGLTATDTLWSLEMLFDSIDNRAGILSGTTIMPSTYAYQFLLYPSDTNSSNSTIGTQYPRYNRPAGAPADPVINFPVTAGNYVSMSVTFKNGDPTYPAFPGKDTIRLLSGSGSSLVETFKYSEYDAEVAFVTPTSGGTTASFPTYGWPNDKTTGYFKEESYDDNYGPLYAPNWAYSSTPAGGGPAGPSTLQFPYILYHAKCPTCNLLGNPVRNTIEVKNIANNNSINAYPNPSANQLNIAFSLGQVSAVSVTLTDMLGQVVATQNMGNVANGNAVFNTADLANGMYIYTLTANGVRTTRHIAVSH